MHVRQSTRVEGGLCKTVDPLEIPDWRQRSHLCAWRHELLISLYNDVNSASVHRLKPEGSSSSFTLLLMVLAAFCI